MIVQPHSALFSATAIARPASSRQNLAALPANAADTVSISQTARDLYAVHATQPKPASSAGGNARAEYDTNKGTLELDIEAYFTPPGSQGIDLDSLPLLMPSQKNIDALSGYISAHMPTFLADNGIPTPPANITYDTMGQIQLPSGYPYAAKFKQALETNPVIERALRTTSALASTMVEMRKSIPFQQEYAAATSQTEIEAVVAKYHYLFSANRHYDSIALDFTADGVLSITHDGKSLSEA
jgi:hypothetical protein